MIALEWIWWAAAAVVFYTYLGYGLLAAALVWWRERAAGVASLSVSESSGQGSHRDGEGEPPVTLLIAAYNEADVVLDKVLNSFDLDYPRDKLRIWFVTDGSTDETTELLRAVPGVDVFHESARRGKIAAVQRVMSFVSTPVVVFSDANTMLNREAIRRIVRHYADPNVGAVSGEKRVASADETAVSSEGLYWRYESRLKRLDSRLHSVVGAAGELFSLRTRLFQHVDADTILDDFVLTMRVAESGYRVVYEPEAFALEPPSADLREELKRKVRICAGGFQAMTRLRGLLNPLRHGILTLQYVFHRKLRWTLAPLLLPVPFSPRIRMLASVVATFSMIE